MANLKWDKNFWINDVDSPELTEHNLRGLFHEATISDEKMLNRRGIKMTGGVGFDKQFYILEPFIYFEDENGIFAIHYNMRPNQQGKISYYEWNYLSKIWKKSEDMYADE
jgi:hypothetical protein